MREGEAQAEANERGEGEVMREIGLGRGDTAGEG